MTNIGMIPIKAMAASRPTDRHHPHKEEKGARSKDIITRLRGVVNPQRKERECKIF
jgi:hypothetical protein